MLFYTESPSIVDLARAEKLFRIINSLLCSNYSLGQSIASCLLFTDASARIHKNSCFQPPTSAKAFSNSTIQDLMDLMNSHYRHIQGEGFWPTGSATTKEEIDTSAKLMSPRRHMSTSTLNGDGSLSPPVAAGDKMRLQTLFEVFVTVLLYYLRSYYLNSPTNNVSEADLSQAWRCRV